MAKYILKRILMLIPVVIGITLFIFVIMSLAPGDPATLILGADATYEEILAKRMELGLNDPVLIRYLKYMVGVIQGDFGISWYNGYNVMSEFLSRIPNTLILGLLSNAIVIMVGIPLGVIAAVKQNGVIDYCTLILAMLFSSMPAFWFGLMAQIYFCLNLGWFPATGADSLKNFVLPAVTLASASLAGQVRLTRTSMLEVNKLDYVRTARSKGCSESRIILKHVLRNGLLPVVTGIGGHIATIVGGAIVTESVFAIPGVASLMINAVKIRDVPVVMGIIVVISVFVGVVNLLVDLTYAVIDPRVKLNG
ncbi:Dipeptide transport system permease protein dppB [uncultured Clostridium sp.]|uniref:ABC transporter permease n=3 Tax=Enterocloster citroniae TaxID=358743 RepID=UPI00082202F7|nr:ABC transporter permease [Clostridium sp.]SCI11592.1 Dipeptide transport system permease protein dppB [uncultured Clostridium sp.]